MTTFTTSLLASDWGNLDACKQHLQDIGRLQLKQVLSPQGAELVSKAAELALFHLSINSGAKSFDLALNELETLSGTQMAQMTALVHAGARDGFQYYFDTYRLSDEVDAGKLQAGPLFDLYRELNSEPILNVFRQLSDEPAIEFCDAQVTRYRPGHFLTEHDDDMAGKGRVLAFVLNLTVTWRSDWGGLLLFHGHDGHIEAGFSPVFNALNVFTVPQSHSVSLVAPFAGGCRYSVTGWARKRVE
jgi:SM-20-related protein